MFFQQILKGINDLSQADSLKMLNETGIICNFWRNYGQPSQKIVSDLLTERNLDWHLNHYDDYDPLTGEIFSRVTPFISTTAGSVDRDQFNRTNISTSAFLTSLTFATDTFRSSGVVFYGYVFTLGKKSIPLHQFSEEVRELHIYSSYLPYYREGEIAAKIYIPSVQLFKVECYDGPKALADLKKGTLPTPSWYQNNPNFADPSNYCNIREAIL